MATWNYKFDLKEVWQNEAMTKVQKAYTVLILVKSLIQESVNSDIQEYFEENLQDEFDSLIEYYEQESEASEFDEDEFIEDFDSLWSDFYDFCDSVRIWVNLA